jgi:hypothetical protein
MRSFALAFVVWPTAFAATLGGLAWSNSPTEATGQIVVERAPFCDHFIVQTPDGYVTAVDLTGDRIVLTGARSVRGRLYQKGSQRISVGGTSTMHVAISHFDTDWTRARDRFETDCQHLPDIAADVIATSIDGGLQ